MVSFPKYGRFAWGLKQFLRKPISPSMAREQIRQRLQSREQLLLAVAGTCIYPHASSPYQKLLAHAGCTFGDLKKLVLTEGCEGTLEKLAGEGVYVSSDEFKGKLPARRGSATFSFRETDFDNCRSTGYLRASTGASRSHGTRTVYDLDHLAEKWAGAQILRFDIYGRLGFPLGMWLPIMPGAGPIALLSYAKAGLIPERWFSPLESRNFKPSLKNRLGTRYIVQAARLFGCPLPAPQHVPLDEAETVARWMRDTLDRQGRCNMATYVSAAVRISQAARKRGWDLTGAAFSVSSEPFTRVKQNEILASGADVFPMYAFMEAGVVGLGCAQPDTPDEQHVMTDSTVLIPQRRVIGALGIEVDTLLFTTLLVSSPKILFNTENGDYGTLERRSCGCPLEAMGLGCHLHSIRSFEKLTVEGMSFLGEKIMAIVEHTLPARFGGDAMHYQIVEEETQNGQTRMFIQVSPDLGPISDQDIIDCVLLELHQGNDAQRMMAGIWKQAKTLKIRRQAPIPTPRGKVLPLHIVKTEK